MNIGIVIKEVRKQRGFTQLELSETAKISVRTIQRIENDEVEPSFYSLKSIGEILKVDLLEIKNRNSMVFTTRILGLKQNDLTMKQEDNTTLEERLEKIESHLSSIARTRSIQLRTRRIVWICIGIIVTAFIVVEVLMAFREFG
jgi:transcriptional regulator with XRE-family HTH domain